jgi:hypothetical protein
MSRNSGLTQMWRSVTTREFGAGVRDLLPGKD